MPAVPNFFERLLLSRQPQLTPFLDLWAAGAFQGIELASTSGIFEALKTGLKAPATIAQEIKADARGVRILLDLLASFGYVAESRGSYSLTSVSSSLLSDSSFNMADTFKLYAGLFKFVREHQEEAIRNGKPAVNVFEWFDEHPEMWKLFHSFEASIAKSLGDEIVSKIRLPPGPRRLLDVGGGHGLYSIMLCKRYPDLSATVFDSPSPIEDAKLNIASEKMASQISVQAGNFFEDDLGSGYDAALLFNIVHLFPSEANLRLFNRVTSALKPGATVIIFDQFLGGEFGKVARVAHTYYSLLFLTTTGGQLYSFSEISELLSQAGLTITARKPIRAAASHLVFATKRNLH